MRHTEFWARMEPALGLGLCATGRRSRCIGDLGQRTASRRSMRARPQGGLARGVAGPRAAAGRAVTQAAAGRLELVAVQRRTVRDAGGLPGPRRIGITIGIATAPCWRDISGPSAKSGLAQTGQVLGAAVASYLLARLMARRGRRAGLVGGICSVPSAGVAGRARRRGRIDGRCCSSGRRCSARRRRRTTGPGTPPRTWPRSTRGPARSRSWSGRPPSARWPGPT